jgi:hypothetical protein
MIGGIQTDEGFTRTGVNPQTRRAQALNAEGETRTPMPRGATPSRWCVYQFHHFGKTRLRAGCSAKQQIIYNFVSSPAIEMLPVKEQRASIKKNLCVDPASPCLCVKSEAFLRLQHFECVDPIILQKSWDAPQNAERLDCS